MDQDSNYDPGAVPAGPGSWSAGTVITSPTSIIGPAVAQGLHGAGCACRRQRANGRCPQQPAIPIVKAANVIKTKSLFMILLRKGKRTFSQMIRWRGCE